MKPNQESGLTYKAAGVDIDKGNALVERIKPIAKRTHRPELLSGLGGFGALFELPLQRFRQPIMVSSTDGVGTKLKLALALAQHHTIGIDLVAMCVNDIIVCGAEPLLFLDYYATGGLDIEVATAVIEGIGIGCERAGAVLAGGETAEMPGMYADGEYDLAGFCVGLVDKPAIIDGSRVQTGDVLLALASNGIHANGYSLVRKILDTGKYQLDNAFEQRTLGETLLDPTRIYVKPLLQLMQHIPIHAIAHITGGGLLDNIPRVLPSELGAYIAKSSWQFPAIFEWLQQAGQITDEEMYRTFNCGIGMVVCVAKEHSHTALLTLQEAGETVWELGEIQPRAEKQAVVFV